MSNIRTYVDQNRNEASTRVTDDSVDAAIQLELDQVESSVGLNSDGTLTTITGNYTSGANIIAVIRNLDTQIKTNTDEIALHGSTVALQNEIDDIETGAGLGTDGTYSANVGTNYIGSATSLVDADEKLDAKLKLAVDDIADEITDRVNGDSATENHITVVQTGAGLSATGTYLAENTTTYLKIATSLKNADEKLDSAITALATGKLDASTYTATDILTKIKTVDGDTSGLDADTVDGYEAADLIYEPFNFVITSVNVNAVSGDQFMVNTTSSAVTITLPAVAVINNFIEILDLNGTFDVNNLTINRNGHKIMGLAENLILDVKNSHTKLIFANVTMGWKLL